MFEGILKEIHSLEEMNDMYSYQIASLMVEVKENGGDTKKEEEVLELKRRLSENLKCVSELDVLFYKYPWKKYAHLRRKSHSASSGGGSHKFS